MVGLYLCLSDMGINMCEGGITASYQVTGFLNGCKLCWVDLGGGGGGRWGGGGDR